MYDHVCEVCGVCHVPAPCCAGCSCRTHEQLLDQLEQELADEQKKHESDTVCCELHHAACQICGRGPLIHVDLTENGIKYGQMLCPWCLRDIDWRQLAHQATGSR